VRSGAIDRGGGFAAMLRLERGSAAVPLLVASVVDLSLSIIIHHDDLSFGPCRVFLLKRVGVWRSKIFP
jgi:hypothetical protein